MNSVVTPRRPQPPPTTRAALLLIGVAGALGLLFLLARLGGSEEPPSRRLIVDNQTTYNINVQVSGANRDGWLDIGSFGRQTRRDVEEVADQGRVWVFRFSYGGVDAGEVVVDREQLVKDGWRITVPTEAGQRLREAGLSESAG